MELILYHFPITCSRVTMTALEKIGCPYTDRIVSLLADAHHDPAYLAINPKAKVPLLLVDGQALSETPAILSFLSRSFPEAQLLPTGTSFEQARALADLVWFGGTLHPAVHRIFRPTAYSQVDAEGVSRSASVLLAGHADRIDAVLTERPWWLASGWSIADNYLAWIFATAKRSGFSIEKYAAIRAHHARVEAMPAHQAALQRERDAVARDKLVLPPGMVL